MNYEIKTTELFNSLAKKLSKKFPSFSNDLIGFKEILLNNPRAGTDLGKGFFKVRIQIKSKNKGKRAGARIIYLLINELGVIHLLLIYDKSELGDIAISRLIEIKKSLGL